MIRELDNVELEENFLIEEARNPRYQNNSILQLTMEFSLAAITYCEQLEEAKKYVVAKQLLRSATSIGSNAREAQNAESLVHFVSKFKTSLREADESDYWLEICERAESYPSPTTELRTELETITRIINKIIATTKLKIKK